MGSMATAGLAPDRNTVHVPARQARFRFSQAVGLARRLRLSFDCLSHRNGFDHAPTRLVRAGTRTGAAGRS